MHFRLFAAAWQTFRSPCWLPFTPLYHLPPPRSLTDSCVSLCMCVFVWVGSSLPLVGCLCHCCAASASAALKVCFISSFSLLFCLMKKSKLLRKVFMQVLLFWQMDMPPSCLPLSPLSTAVALLLLELRAALCQSWSCLRMHRQAHTRSSVSINSSSLSMLKFNQTLSQLCCLPCPTPLPMPSLLPQPSLLANKNAVETLVYMQLPQKLA